jgi:hypothetical protein
MLDMSVGSRQDEVYDTCGGVDRTSNQSNTRVSRLINGGKREDP